MTAPPLMDDRDEKDDSSTDAARRTTTSTISRTIRFGLGGIEIARANDENENENLRGAHLGCDANDEDDALPLPRGRCAQNSLTVAENASKARRARARRSGAHSHHSKPPRRAWPHETYYLIDMVWWKQSFAWRVGRLDDTAVATTHRPPRPRARRGGESNGREGARAGRSATAFARWSARALRPAGRYR